MAAGDLSLKIILTAVDQASTVVKQVGSSVQQLAGGGGGAGGGALGAIGIAASVAGAALVGMGTEATKAAADYQQTMNQVQALAGVSATDAQAASAAIMKMSTDLGQSPKTMADGLYYIASAGFDAKDSLNLLELSTKAASVGNTQTEVTANALTAALKAFGLPASDAAHIMDEMTKTVSTGKTEFEDYANIVGKISISARQAGITFEEANAAFATLTNIMPSSKAAADSLNGLLQTTSRLDLLTARADKLGISFDANAYKSMNFEERLKYLMKITDGNQETMAKLLGRQNAVAAATALATSNFAGYNDALKSITNNSGALNAAWEKTSSGFNIQMGRVKASVDVLLIAIGNQLLPILTEIAKFVAPVIAGFAQWITSSNAIGAAISAFGGKAGKTFDDLRGILGVTWGYIQSIFGLIGDALSLVFGHDIQQASTVIGSFARDAILGFNSVLMTINELLDPIVHSVLPACLKLSDAISGGVMTAFKAFAGIIGGDLKKNFGSLDQSAAGLVSAIEAIGDAMNQAAGYINTLQPVFQQIGTFLGETFKPVLDDIVVEFNERVKPAWEQFVESIGPAMPTLKFLGEVLGVALVMGLKSLAEAAAFSLRVGVAAMGLFTAGVFLMGKAVMDSLALMSKAWNAIVAVWNAAPGFFVGIWNAVKKAFSDAWTWVSQQATAAWKWVINAWGATGKWFQDVGTAITRALSDAWKWVQQTAKSAWDEIVRIVTAPINNLINQFKWLYQHNYYFQDLVDSVRKWFQDFFTWAETSWNSTILWLTKLWEQLTHSAADLWGKINAAIMTALDTAGKFIEEQWNRLTGWLSQQWNTLSANARSAWDAVAKVFNDVWSAISTALTNLWNNISKWWTQTQSDSQKASDAMWKSVSTTFSNAWTTYISKPLTTLGTNIGNWFTTQTNNIKKWADTMMKQFGDSITTGFHYVTTALTNLGNEIVKLLGFHSPPAAGPLSKSDQWMPAFMKMLANGISLNTKGIIDAITNIANEIKKLLGISSPAATGGSQTGPLQSAGTWMSNLTTKFANGIVAGIPKVSLATTQLANTISATFTLLNAQMNSSTSSITNQMMLLSSNVGAQSNTISAQFATLQANVSTAAAGITTSVANVNTQISGSAGQITASMGQASSAASAGAQQVASSGQQAAGSADFASSSVQTHFGNTTQYVTQTVQGVSSAGEAMSQAADEAQKHSNKAIEAIKDNIKSALMGDAMGNLTSFLQFVSEFAQTVQAEISYAAAGIASLMGHSKPKEGPLTDDDLWGKHFMENIIGGMVAEFPVLSGITNRVAGLMASVQVSPFSRSSSPPVLVAGSPQSNQPMVVQIHLDKKVIGKVALQYQQKEVHVQAGVRSI